MGGTEKMNSFHLYGKDSKGLQNRNMMNCETIEKKINLFFVCENSSLGVNTLINAGNKK